MKTATSSNTLRWVCFLFIFALIAIISPRIIVRSSSTQRPSDPVVDEIRSQYASTDTWLHLDDDARTLALENSEMQSALKSKKLELFNAISAAEKALDAWIAQHPQSTPEVVGDDQTGKKLLTTLKDCYVTQEDARLQIEALDNAQEEITRLRKSLRMNLVKGSQDTNALEDAQGRLNQLRLKTAKDNVDRRKAAEIKAENDVQSTVHQMLR